MANDVDVKKLVEEHPELKNSLSSMLPNAENVKSFSSIAEARKMLKFLTVEKVVLTESVAETPGWLKELDEIKDSNDFKTRNRNIGSGQIRDTIKDGISVLEYYTRHRDYAIMMFDALDVREGNSFNIHADSPTTVKLEAEEGHEMIPEFIRMCIVKCNTKTKTAETVTHFDSKNSLKFTDKDGNIHYIFKTDFSVKDEKKGGETSINGVDTVIAFDVNETKGTISYYTTGIPEDYIILGVPLFWNVAFKNSVYTECKESWERGLKKSFLKNCVETKLDVPPYKDDVKELIKSKIDTEITNNKQFDISLASYDVIHECSAFIFNAIDSIGAFDEFTTFSQIYPKYGSETIDSGDYKLDPETGLPVLGPKDVINLGILGIDKKFIGTTIESTKQVVLHAKDTISINSSRKLSEEDRLTDNKVFIDLINSECFTPRSIITNEGISDDYSELISDLTVDGLIEDAKKFIEDAYNQFAEFKLMSLRMEQKIKSGEFMNRSSQAYYEVLKQVFKKFAGDKFEDFGVYVNFLKTCNGIINSKLKSDCSRISNAIVLSIFHDNKISGNPLTLQNIISDKIYSLLDFESTAGNTSNEELINKVKAIANKLSFIELLSYMPFKIVGRLYPESVFAPSTGTDPSESMVSISKELFDMGFSCLNENPEYNDEIQTKLKNVKDRLEEFRKEVISNYDSYLNQYKESLDEINSLIASIELAIGIIDTSDLTVDGSTAKQYLPGSTIEVKKIRLKTDADKNRALAKREILTQIKSHIVNIVTGYEACDLSETKDLNDKDNLIYKLDKEGKPATISVEDYGKLEEKDRNDCMILRSLSKEQRINYMIDAHVAFGTYIIFMLCLDRISSEFTDLATSKTGASRNKDYQDFERKCFSTLSLLIPNITVLDSFDVRKSVDENGKLDLSEIITNDIKVNLGPNVVSESLDVFKTKDDLAKIRYEFINESIDFVNSCLEFLM